MNEEREQQILAKIREYKEEYPAFDDGRINYTHADKAAALNVFVMCGDELLLLRRSDKVTHYKHQWCSVAGYYDTETPVKEKAKEEIKEELEIQPESFASFHIGEPWTFFDDTKEIEWYIVPVIAELSEKLDVTLNWEHDECKWIAPDELSRYHTIPNLPQTYQQARK